MGYVDMHQVLSLTCLKCIWQDARPFHCKKGLTMSQMRTRSQTLICGWRHTRERERVLWVIRGGMKHQTERTNQGDGRQPFPSQYHFSCPIRRQDEPLRNTSVAVCMFCQKHAFCIFSTGLGYPCHEPPRLDFQFCADIRYTECI